MSGEPEEAVSRQTSAANELVHAYLVSLAFRFRHVTEGAPEHFGDFEAGSGVRTPVTIVRHMTGLLLWVWDMYEPGSKYELAELSFDAECARFLDTVSELARVFGESTAPGATARRGSAHDFSESTAAEFVLAPRSSDLTFAQLWRGPLTDAMTHVGQLATLRRLAGDPIGRVRYWQVEMPPLHDR